MTAPEAPATLRLFGSPAYLRLWIAQVVSSLGDWLGFIAVTAIAARIGGSSPETAVGVVLSARLIPGFFLGTVAGVLVDRWDRKKVMVVCDVGRGLVLATLPFVDSLPGLFLASLMLELFTLCWGPAKDASVPNMVRPDFLANANSLSLVAAYGTFPIGSLIFAALAKVAAWLSNYDALSSLRVSQENVAIWVDVWTFLLSAVIIASIKFPLRAKRFLPPMAKGIDFSRTFRELHEGFRFIGTSPLVRSVMLGLGTGLIGAGMLVPLGPVFVNQVLGGGSAGFGLLLTALGTGMAVGIVLLSFIQKRLPRERTFIGAVLASGGVLIAGASMSTLAPALILISLLGLSGGAVYVMGFTILQTSVDDDLRGRIFATLNTLVRFSLLLAFALAPVLSGLLDSLSDHLLQRQATIGPWQVALPGVRLTLWFGGGIIMGAGLLAGWALRGRVIDPAGDTEE